MDRNFKLRQMFSDYLEIKARGSGVTPPPFPPPEMQLSALSEEDKKRALCKKITEEEAETFDLPDNARPVIIAEPSVELKWYNKVSPTASVRQSSEEDTLKLAQRLLQLFIKTEMLEASMFKYDDIRLIRVFFMDDREAPSEKLVIILDNILTVAMTKSGQFSDKLAVVVDYQLRAFMSDPNKAKRLILETMLKFPEYIPDSWGGEAAMMKWKEAKEADVRRRDADEKDREKEEKAAAAAAAAESERKEVETKKKEKEEKIKREVEDAEKKKKDEKERRRKEAQEQKKKEEKARKEEEERKKKEEKAKKDEEERMKKDKTERTRKEEDPKKKDEKKKTKRREKKAPGEKTREITVESGVSTPSPSGPTTKKSMPLVRKLPSKETGTAPDAKPSIPSPATAVPMNERSFMGVVGGVGKKLIAPVTKITKRS